jgi:hypothetical protein
MRYLDIAVAAMVGTAAITGLSVWSPAQGDRASASFQERSTLRDGIVAFVEIRGMPWLASAPWSKICAAIGEASNSTLVLSAEMGSSSCGTVPSPGSDFVSITFQLDGDQVAITAW